MLLSLRDFSAGFVVGFGAGVAFRSLADSDFESVKGILKTGMGVMQKAGDAAMDGFGRLREAIEDVGAWARAESVREKTRKPQADSRSVAQPRRKKKAAARRTVEYHA